MKKLLLASTAIVGFAGAAAAEVKLSGYAEMGIRGGDDIETQFHNDVVINFDFSGTTDGGIEFGGRVQLDDNGDPNDINGTPGFDDEAFWVSGAFGKVTLGETDGAFDWALSEIYLGTSLADDHSTHAGAYWFTGLDGGYDNQILRYEYSFGDFGVALSAEQDDGRSTTTGGGLTYVSGRPVGDTTWGIGAKWSGQVGGMDADAGIGYQSNGTVDAIGLSGGITAANGMSAKLGYANIDAGAAGDADWWGIGLGYQAGALLVQVNYGEWDLGGAADPSGFGLVANYDLGGGAVAMVGYGSSDNGVSWNGGGEDTFSMGLGLSF